MKIDWKNWCRLCGSSAFTTKFEATPELAKTFKISESVFKACFDCNSYLTGFQEFLSNSNRINELFSELSMENYLFLDIERINEIRAKYDLNPVELNHEVEAFLLDPINQKAQRSQEFQIKSELVNNEVNLIIHNNLINQFPPDSEEDKIESDEEPKRKRCSTRRRPTKRKRRHSDSGNSDDPDFVLKEERNREKNEIASVLPIKCHICNEVLKKFTHLINHCKIVHDCTPSILCVCGLMIHSQQTYYTHRKNCVRKHNKKEYECDKCGIQYKTKEIMEAHILREHSKNSVRHICDVCGKEYMFLKTLNKHKTTHETDGIDCPICQKKMSGPHSLKAHMRYNHGACKSYTCNICMKVFQNRTKLLDHKSDKHSNEKIQSEQEESNDSQDFSATKKIKKEKPEIPRKKEPRKLELICHICKDGPYKKFTRLENHCEEMHNTCPSIVCACKTIINNIKLFYKHQKFCIKQKGRHYECDYDGIMYKSKEVLRAHMDRIHRQEPIRYFCDVCGKEYMFKKSLDKHRPTHDIQDMKCNICDKKVAGPHSLKIHIRNCHSGGEQSFICHICSAIYKHKSGMDYHLKTAHIQTKKFKCPKPECGKRFRHSSHLRFHVDTVHGPKPFSCPHCPFRTARNIVLKKHIFLLHTHTDLRPFKCACGKDFKQLKTLQNHRNSVHKTSDNNFSCMFCSAVVKMRSSLLRHHKKFHPIEFANYQREKKLAEENAD